MSENERSDPYDRVNKRVEQAAMTLQSDALCLRSGLLTSEVDDPEYQRSKSICWGVYAMSAEHVPHSQLRVRSELIEEASWKAC